MTKPWSPLSEANESFTADDIATPENDLVCWEVGADNTAAINQALKENFTRLPVRKNGRIVGVLTTQEAHSSDEPDWERLTIDWLIADSTPILELIGMFAANPDYIYFMLDSSEIAGLITSADLNKTAARAAVYLLLAEFESSLADLIRGVYPEEDDYCPLLSPERVQKLREESEQARSGNMELDLLNYMYLTDLVTIVAKDEHLRQMIGFSSRRQADEAMSVSYVRNLVGHPVGLMVQSAESLQKLNETCHRLIDLHERINEAQKQ